MVKGKEDYFVSMRGERTVWIDFVAKCKKEKKSVWQVISGFIREYMLRGLK